MAARLPGSQADDFARSAVFSPDNQWLIVGSASGYRWWRVGSWEPGLQITKNRVEAGAYSVAFSRDGQLLAILPTPQEVRLLDPNTGLELATLTAPDRHMISWLCFSPDGCQLAAATQDSLIQLWDLRTIRARLAALGLDWDCPPYPPRTDTDTARTIHVRVEPGRAASVVPPTVAPSDLRREVALYSFALALAPFNFRAYSRRAWAHSRLGEAQQAIDDYRQALMLLALGNQHGLDQNQAETCNALAWLYVTGPERVRDPNQALPLAQRAVRIAPENSNYRNTLGVVYYRLGQWDAAVEALERDPRNNAHDLFFLAMCYEQLGEPTKARQRYDRALQWWQSQGALIPSDEVEELNAFRAEAAAVLKIVSKPSP
jgi:tetratricopeptide (TPR) repeat protein